MLWGTPEHNGKKISLANAITTNNKIGKFVLCQDGVYKKSKDPNGNFSTKKICGVLKVVAWGRDSQSEDWKKLVLFDDIDGVTHKVFIPYSTLLNNDKLTLEPLVNAGLDVKSGIDTVAYIRSCDPNKRVTITYKVGWHKISGSNYFVLPDGQVPNNNIVAVMLDSSVIAPAIGSKGTLEEWQDNIAIPAAASSRSILTICTAFAAPLVSLGNRANAGFHLRGILHLVKVLHKLLDVVLLVLLTTSKLGKARQMD